MKPKTSTVVIITCVAALATSLAVNAILLRQADQYYLELNAVRLDPLGLTVFNRTDMPVDETRPTAVFVGDSRAAQWPPPDASRFVVVNCGIGTQTTAQVAGRFVQHIAPLKPDMVIIQAGINDLKTIGLFPDNEQRIVEDTIRNLRELIEASRQAGANVIVTTIIPSTGDVPLVRQRYWSDRVDMAVQQVNDEIRTWADDGVMILDAATLLADERGNLQRDFATDLLHVNAAGYAVLNHELARLLTQIGAAPPATCPHPPGSLR